MNLAVDDPEFSWDDLRVAFTRVYNQARLVLQRPLLLLSPAAAVHVCTKACEFTSSGDVFVCRASCNVHVCNAQYCDQLLHTSEKKVCEFTGRDYELDDDVIFGYDNADRENREYVDGYRTLRDIHLHELQQQHAAVMRPGAECAPPPKRRVHRLHAPPPTPPAAEQPPPPNPSSSSRKKARHTPTAAVDGETPTAAAAAAAAVAAAAAPVQLQQRQLAVDADHHSVRALASTFLSRLGVSFDSPVLHAAADACQVVWDVVVRTKAFTADATPQTYKQEYHVAVVLTRMRTSSIEIRGRRTPLAPHIPELHALFLGPRSFANRQFNVPTTKFTACDTLLRRCLMELDTT